MIRIEPYAREQRAEWDRFVAASRNGTFLFLRDYMEHHGDLYRDCSLTAWLDDDMVAVLPAHTDGSVLHSHKGLSYGGFVFGDAMTAPRMIEVLAGTLGFMEERGLDRLEYRTVPHIYHRLPSEEDRYALLRRGARVVRSDVLSVIAAEPRLRWQRRRRRGANKARSSEVRADRSSDWQIYWHLLETCLDDRHDARPVHSYDEIARLAERLPNEIQLFAASRGG